MHAPAAAVHAPLTLLRAAARHAACINCCAAFACLPASPARSQFSSLSKTSSTSQTITTNSGAQVYLGGVSLGAGKQALGRSWHSLRCLCCLLRLLLVLLALPVLPGLPAVRSASWTHGAAQLTASSGWCALGCPVCCRCAGPGYLELDPDFVANVRPLVAAAKLNAYDQVGGRCQHAVGSPPAHRRPGSSVQLLLAAMGPASAPAC